MITETDVRVLHERRKEFERAARKHQAARDATQPRSRHARRNPWARLAALFV